MDGATTAVDVWAAGVVLLTLLCRTTQFQWFRPNDLCVTCSRMYIKSMDAVWKHNYGYTGQYRDKIRDVIEDFKLDVEVKLLSSALLYHEDEDEGDMEAGSLSLLT
ncbi:hypothetical protein GUITHDRAFT_155543 [Guillardia theta CCMP2712]|uniref:Protein kinase domain-containing protein n=1 Tax=Guillardia theta (strain CCMP2712) TaxID=905079 RepID=L1IGX3_GUITC|nr:hypothetical protein GUITHDRAFT_155543 [Guillardia theta CCMP2712]EKX35312.1 hypothetical protein GUITHDRAFT_155543 [Guillardia theta CCMP2712]|eukprot:XP_005822292.1 hypothetical protein GUITHDRAFT_155543 [Guillardia theta CCMP2712]